MRIPGSGQDDEPEVNHSEDPLNYSLRRMQLAVLLTAL
jgi:hypothetical protein